jgi:hypothetical protein
MRFLSFYSCLLKYCNSSAVKCFITLELYRIIFIHFFLWIIFIIPIISFQNSGFKIFIFRLYWKMYRLFAMEFINANIYFHWWITLSIIKKMFLINISIRNINTNTVFSDQMTSYILPPSPKYVHSTLASKYSTNETLVWQYLWTKKAKFKAAWRKYLNIHSFYCVRWSVYV